MNNTGAHIEQGNGEEYQEENDNAFPFMKDKNVPIDWEKGKEYYGNDAETLREMI